MTIAYAHSGLSGKLGTTQDIFNLWSFDPLLLIALVSALLYLRGWARYRRSGSRHFPRWRLAAMLSGLVMIGLALASPIDALADRSFTWHMVQHLLVTVIGPPLILLSAPFLPMIRGLPKPIRHQFFIPFAKNAMVRWFARKITLPQTAFALLHISLFFWHYPAFYDLALHNRWVHYLEHITFMFAAGLFWWNVINPFPFPNRLPEPLGVAYLFLSSIINTALAAMISFSDQALYDYRLMEFMQGWNALEDQRVGGIIMWVVGGLIHLTAILTLFFLLAQKAQALEPPRSLNLSGQS